MGEDGYVFKIHIEEHLGLEGQKEGGGVGG